MTNSEIIKTLSQRLEQSQVDIKNLLKASTDAMRDILDKDIGITIPGLGTFIVFLRKKRKSFDPYHRRFLILPPKRVIRYHPSASTKNELKNKRF